MRDKNPDMVAGEKKKFVMRPPQVRNNQGFQILDPVRYEIQPNNLAKIKNYLARW